MAVAASSARSVPRNLSGHATARRLGNCGTSHRLTASPPVVASGEPLLERVPLLDKHLGDYETAVEPGTLDRIRELAEPLRGAARAARERDRVRRWRRRAPGHARRAAPRSRDRGRLAGDPRQRRVLRRDQAGPQRVARRRRGVEQPDGAHLPRAGARQRAPTRRRVGLRGDARPAARRDARVRAQCRRRPREHEVDLALPHRPDRREPEGMELLPGFRRAIRRVGVDDAAVRSRRRCHARRRCSRLRASIRSR